LFFRHSPEVVFRKHSEEGSIGKSAAIWSQCVKDPS